MTINYQEKLKEFKDEMDPQIATLEKLIFKAVSDRIWVSSWMYNSNLRQSYSHNKEEDVWITTRLVIELKSVYSDKSYWLGSIYDLGGQYFRSSCQGDRLSG